MVSFPRWASGGCANFGNTRWGAETTFWRQNEVWCKKKGSAGLEPSREDHKSGALTTTLEGYNVRGWSAGGGQRFRAETAEGVFNFAFALPRSAGCSGTQELE